MKEYGPLSTLPLGMPNLFGQTGQQLPKEFLSAIAPQLDIMPFISAANCLEAVAGFVAVPNNGQLDFSGLIVPDSEAWLVRGAYYSVGLTAAGSQGLKGRLYLSRRYAGSAYSEVLLTGDVCDCGGTSALDRTFLASLGWPAPFLMYPGDRIGINAETLNGAPGLGRYCAMIFRFTV